MNGKLEAGGVYLEFGVGRPLLLDDELLHLCDAVPLRPHLADLVAGAVRDTCGRG